MPDLSKMLGDVYDAPTTTAADVAYRPASPAGRPAPDWADDERLDKAFAGWTPGPSADAPAAERKLFAGSADAPAPLADDLAAALSEAVLAEQVETDETPAFDHDDDHETGLTPVNVAPTMTATAFGGLTSDAPPRPAVPVPVPAEEDEVEVEEPTMIVEDEAVELAPEPIFRSSGGWQRADDDILPGSGGGGGGKKFFSLSLRRG
jgi:hypothetical protein